MTTDYSMYYVFCRNLIPVKRNNQSIVLYSGPPREQLFICFCTTSSLSLPVKLFSRLYPLASGSLVCVNVSGNILKAYPISSLLFSPYVSAVTVFSPLFDFLFRRLLVPSHLFFLYSR